MTYRIDIDLTICSGCVQNGKNVYANAQPIKENIEKINKLYDQGHTIIYWTSRGATTGIDWTHLTLWQLNNWGCKFHDLKLDKPAFDYIVDDKCFNINDI